MTEISCRILLHACSHRIRINKPNDSGLITITVTKLSNSDSPVSVIIIERPPSRALITPIIKPHRIRLQDNVGWWFLKAQNINREFLRILKASAIYSGNQNQKLANLIKVDRGNGYQFIAIDRKELVIQIIRVRENRKGNGVSLGICARKLTNQLT